MKSLDEDMITLNLDDDKEIDREIDDHYGTYNKDLAQRLKSSDSLFDHIDTFLIDKSEVQYNNSSSSQQTNDDQVETSVDVSKAKQKYAMYADYFTPSYARQEAFYDDPDTLRFNECMEVYNLASDFKPPSLKHITSYDKFVFTELPKIIKNHTMRVVSRIQKKIHVLKFGDIFYSFPKISEKMVDPNSNDPHSGMNSITNHVECEERRTSYIASIFVSNAKHIIYEFGDKRLLDVKEIDNLFIGDIPVMVQSQLDTAQTG